MELQCTEPSGGAEAGIGCLAARGVGFVEPRPDVLPHLWGDGRMMAKVVQAKMDVLRPVH